MGGGQPGPGSNNPPPPSPQGTQISDLWNVLNQIWNLLLGVFGLGGSAPVFLQTKITTHLVYQPLASTPFRVKKAIIQNPTSTDVLLIDGNIHAGVAISAPTDGKGGFILNPAGTSGQGGGTHPFGNIDLSQIFVTVTVTDGTVLSTYCEQ